MRRSAEPADMVAIQANEDYTLGWLVRHKELPTREQVQRFARLLWLVDTRQINEYGCEEEAA